MKNIKFIAIFVLLLIFSFYNITFAKKVAITDTHKLKGKIYELMKEKKYDEAINRIIPFLEANPKNSTIRVLLAKNYSRKGDYMNAMKYCKKAFEIDPYSIHYLNEGKKVVFEILYRTKREKELNQFIDSVIGKASSNQPTTLYNVNLGGNIFKGSANNLRNNYCHFAYYFYRFREYEKALELVNKAIPIDRKILEDPSSIYKTTSRDYHAYAYKTKLDIVKKLKRHDEIISFCLEAVKLLPYGDRKMFYSALVESYKAKGNSKKANFYQKNYL